MVKKLSAYKTYLIYSAITGLCFSLIATIMIVYHVEKVHLNPLQLILVGTTLEAACFIFEIPTGIVADVYSRKLSIVIGTVLMGVGFILEGSVPSFIFVLLAQIVWGLGATFISGATEAWIAEEEKTRDLEQVYIKGAQAGQVGSVVGIILSTIIANFYISMPFIISGCLSIILGIFLAFFMPEMNFKTSAPEDINTFRKMGHTFKTGYKFIKSKSIIVILLLVTLFYGLSSEGYDRLSNAHFLQDTTLPRLWNLQPVTWFGIFGIAGMILSTIVMQLISKRIEKEEESHSGRLLLGVNAFYTVFMLVFALTKNFNLMLIAFLSVNMFRTINEPVFSAWLNNHIEDNARATILSMNSQINAFGQIIGGPIIGIIATKFSIGIGIACTSLLVTPVLALYMISIIMDKKSVNKI
ncbi:MFS transporter [Clostridium sp. 'White wine YQ']|uniref:MFS transporter n=1 Tax=Clostridium sp. 'White wine YQ' TaxID=3027474 RepID=UPI002366DFDF|nr:MFS transporter [Clostridium sp. 'White wine YQ']MDD7794349.1 MFS transporter [Clostridium sp. 'White wine YQ']